MPQVTVNNEDSDESFESSWSYMQHIQSNALVGHDRRTFHKEVTQSKVITDFLKNQSPYTYCPWVPSLVCFGSTSCHSSSCLFISIIQLYRLIILKNKVELAQFQNSAPEYLTLAEGFWKALLSLPVTYDYSAYRQMFQTYGTHYLSEGSLGGEYQALLELSQQALSSTSKNRWSHKSYTRNES